MSLSVPALLSAVSAAVAAVSGVRESPTHPDTFGLDPTRELNGAYTISIPMTTLDDPRTRTAGASLGKSVVIVRMISRCRADAAVADYAAGLTLEAAVLAGLGAVSRTDLSYLTLDSITRAPLGEIGYTLHTITLTARHRLTH